MSVTDLISTFLQSDRWHHLGVGDLWLLSWVYVTLIRVSPDDLHQNSLALFKPLGLKRRHAQKNNDSTGHGATERHVPLTLSKTNPLSIGWGSSVNGLHVGHVTLSLSLAFCSLLRKRPHFLRLFQHFIAKHWYKGLFSCGEQSVCRVCLAEMFSVPSQ